MGNHHEDEQFLRLIGEIIRIEKEIEKPCLLERKVQLKKEIDKLYEQRIISVIGLDRIKIRETSSEFKGIIRILREGFGYEPLNISDYWGDWHEEILERYQYVDGEFLDRGSFANRYFQLTPPYVKAGTHIPERVKSIYHESRMCFVFGQYNSAVVLSRSMIEMVLKKKCRIIGSTLAEIIETAHTKKLITDSTKDNLLNIKDLANGILHRSNPVSEDEAKNAINYLLIFLEEIYFKSE